MVSRLHHLDETPHHLFACVEVSDDSVTQWAASAYVLVSFLIHHLCLVADCNHLVVFLVQSNNGRLIHYNLAIAGYDGVGCAKVHRYVLCQREKSHNVKFVLCGEFTL